MIPDPVKFNEALSAYEKKGNYPYGKPGRLISDEADNSCMYEFTVNAYNKTRKFILKVFTFDSSFDAGAGVDVRYKGSFSPVLLDRFIYTFSIDGSVMVFLIIDSAYSVFDMEKLIPGFDYSYAKQAAGALCRGIECNVAEKNIPETENYEDICDLIRNGDFSRASELAYERYRKTGVNTFGNLYAYANSCGARSSYEDIRPALNILNELIRANDNIARCLFGLLILGVNGTSPHLRNLAREQMKISAENNCVIAQYYYGRFLVDSQMNFSGNSDEGAALLISAINAGFRPAMLYVKSRYDHNDKRFVVYNEIIEEIEEDIIGYSKKDIPIDVLDAVCGKYDE